MSGNYATGNRSQQVMRYAAPLPGGGPLARVHRQLRDRRWMYHVKKENSLQLT